MTATHNIHDGLKHLVIDINKVNLDPSNARTHSEKNLSAIKSSFAQFGQRTPIVVQKQGMIIRAGNGRYLAAKALGWTHIAAVISDDDNATAIQYAIADNRTAELADWDWEVLAEHMKAFDAETIEQLGWSKEDLDAVMRHAQNEATSADADEFDDYDPNDDPKGIKIMGIPQSRGAEMLEVVQELLRHKCPEATAILF